MIQSAFGCEEAFFWRAGVKGQLESSLPKGYCIFMVHKFKSIWTKSLKMKQKAYKQNEHVSLKTTWCLISWTICVCSMSRDYRCKSCQLHLLNHCDFWLPSCGHFRTCQNYFNSWDLQMPYFNWEGGLWHVFIVRIVIRVPQFIGFLPFDVRTSVEAQASSWIINTTIWANE